MKKLFIFFVGVFIFVGCCDPCIGQIPPQPAYVDENCEAVMPDVLSQVTISDNCELSSIAQIPIVGSTITPPLIGEIVASDASGNITRVTFQVTKVDTISPVITWDGPIAFKPEFEEGSAGYTKFVAFINYDLQTMSADDKLISIPEFQSYMPDSSSVRVWYNTINVPQLLAEE